MKFLSNVSVFLVALVLVSLAGCASLFGEGWNPADASASVDGSNHDGSTIGETDGGGKTDTTSADIQTDSSDATGQDNGTDIAVLTCPSGKAETLLNGMEKSSCCSIVEVEAYELLSTHTAVPATNCPSFGDSDYCLADFEMLAATDPESSCYRVKLWYPQNLKVKIVFGFESCTSSGVCVHEEKFPSGSRSVFKLETDKKLFSHHFFPNAGDVDQDNYKLVPK